MTAKFWAIVPAAGVGKRMNADKPKQYLSLANKTVIECTITRLLQAQVFTKIVIAVSNEDPYWFNLPLAKHDDIIHAQGGKERADSVLSALKRIEGQAHYHDWVLVHDAARPCITVADIHLLIDSLKNDTVGGILALPSADTLKRVEGNNIVETVNRNQIWRALTPQMFPYGLLMNALEMNAGNNAITDEASALELQGLQPKIIEGRPDNIKITRPEDLALAQFYLVRQLCE